MAGVNPTIEQAEGGIVSFTPNNLSRAFYCIYKRAGFEPCNYCFQVLCRTGETDLAQEFLQHVIKLGVSTTCWCLLGITL